MTNKRTTKRALLFSVLSMLLCVTMLMGTTFAWFTDSVSSVNNIIKSGNLDVELEYSKDGDTWTTVNANTNVFESTLWEPGHTEVVYLKVKNVGSLALKYQLGVSVYDEIGSVNVYGDDFNLSDYILYGAAATDAVDTRENAIAAVKDSATELNVPYSTAGNLEAGKETEFAMVVYMPETVGNEANHAKDADIPTITLGIDLFATQYTVESDSFGNDYDAGAYLPVVTTEAELLSALEQGASIKLGADIAVTEQIVIPAGNEVVLDLNGKAITAEQDAATGRSAYALSNYGDLTLVGGTIKARGIYNQDGAKLTVNGTKIVAQDWNGGACIWSYGTGEVYVNDAELIGCTGVISSQGYVEINGGTYTCYSGIADDGTQLTAPTYNIRAYNGLKITDGTFTSRHGVISVGGGEAVIEGGSYTIRFASATTSNVVYVYGNADLTINGGDFISDNTSGKADSGAAVLVSGSNAKLTVTDGTFVGMNGMVSGNATLYGGTYNTVWDYNHYDKLESLLADSYTATQNTDGSWTVTLPQESFEELVGGAGTVSDVYVPAGDYTLPSASNKDVTISGTKDTVITINTPAYHGSNVTLNGVTVKGSGTYTGIQHVNTVTYNDVAVVGEMCLYGEKVVFNNCTFDLNNQYIWTYGAKEVEFNNCTFTTTGKAILIYNEGAGASKVTVKGCTFNATAGAKAGAIKNQNCAAIEIDNFQSSGTGAAHTLITEGNTYNSNFSGEWRIKSFTNGNSVTVNGTEYTQIAIDGKLMTIDADKNVTVG